MDEMIQENQVSKLRMSRKKLWLWVIVGVLLVLVALYVARGYYIEKKIREIPDHGVYGPSEFSTYDWARKNYYREQQALMGNIPADDMESKLLQLLALPDGRVTRELVEQVFGVKMTLSKKYPDVYESQLEMSLLESYYGYDDNRNIKVYNFAFKWIRNERDLPLGNCIDSLKFSHELRKRGWVSNHPLRNSNAYHRSYFIKSSKAKLYMGYDSAVNCVWEVSLSSES